MEKSFKFFNSLLTHNLECLHKTFSEKIFKFESALRK